MKNKHRRPNLYIIAGPNGAGKTTFARKFLPQYAECLEFVNADLIAGGLSPFAPERAAILGGRLMLEQIHSLAERGLDFGFETTLSGKTYVKLLQDIRKGRYLIHIFFLWITNVKLALERIRINRDTSHLNDKGVGGIVGDILGSFCERDRIKGTDFSYFKTCQNPFCPVS